MFRNVIVSILAIFMIFLICSGCAPAPKQLYSGEPLPKEQVSLISDGSSEFSPLNGHGWFRPVKIDGSEILFMPSEVLTGNHSVEVTYNWWTKANFTAVVSTAIPATLGLCFVTAGISCGLGIVIPGYLPTYDMTCQGDLEFHTEGGRNYLVKVAATGNDIATLMQNTSLVIEDVKSKQAVATTLMRCAKGEPRKEESDEHKTGDPLLP